MALRKVDLRKGLPTERQEDRLLDWINRQRAGRVGRKGRLRPLHRIPRGIPGHPCECSLAIALGERAEVVSAPAPAYRLTPYQDFKPLPRYVADFDGRFDAREYPGLIDSRDPLKRLRSWLVDEARREQGYPRGRAAILAGVIKKLDSLPGRAELKEAANED